jgi:hypothetical protein
MANPVAAAKEYDLPRIPKREEVDAFGINGETMLCFVASQYF